MRFPWQPKSPEATAPEERLNDWGAWAGDAVPVWAGQKVDAQSALQLLTVYGCTRLISDQIATMPLQQLRENSDGSREELPLPSWLVEPEVGVSRIAWLSKVLTSLLLDGNAYIAVTVYEGRIVELISLPTSKVTVHRQNGRKVYLYEGREPSYRILHIPAVMLAGADVGFSPVEAARQSLGAGMAVQEFSSRFFSQGAVMSGVIEDPGELNPNKARDMAKAWGRAHSGTRNSHLPGVLQGGATWRATGVTNEQAQFLETRAFTAAEIAGQMFLLDPSDLGIPMMGGSQAITYGNLEQRNARRVQVALMPWIVRLETAISSLLAKPRYVKFNVSALLRGDTKTRIESYGVAIDHRVMTPNEARGFEDWPPLPGGDDFPKPPTPPPDTGSTP